MEGESREAKGGEASLLGWGYTNAGTILGVVLVLWLIVKVLQATKYRWYPYVMHVNSSIVIRKLEDIKSEHFASMADLTSVDPQLRREGAIRVVEIGVGTGVNFAHYPKGTRLIAVEPNPFFKPFYEANKKKFPNVEAEDILVTTGDEMGTIDSNTVDAVVMTLVLCSVDNIDKILQEIHRILAPGGRFYFMEHIAEFDVKKHWLRQKMQHVFTHVLPLWPFIYDGCCLDCDPLPNIEAAGFSSVRADKYYAPVIPFIIFDVEKPNLKGVATK